ncbi:MAG: hypothetical protein HYW34_00910 [Candidatus Brennerbacteria bacterium]|nr:hypothetical protein [Candidatus Brennerbacteria bacterium]
MVSNCDFCDRTKFEERIIAEYNDWYVVASLGQIIGGYTIVIPKAHISCMGALASHHHDNQIESMAKIISKVSCALSLEYCKNNPAVNYPIIMFEHGIIGQSIKHAHLHFLPAIIDLTTIILADFPKAKFRELQHPAHLQELYNERLEPYLLWTVPNGKVMVCWNPPAPSQYLRIIIADILGYPERGNWRNMDPELDKKLWQETVARLKPYFRRRKK